MALNKSIIIVLVALMAFACGEKKEKEQDQTLMKQTIAIHDQLMAQMGALTSLERELELDSTNAEQAKAEQLAKVRAANTEMFDWMREFGGDFSFEEINKGQELTLEKQQLLQSYHDRIVLLQEEINSIINLEQ